MEPPDPERRPTELTTHGDVRVDEWFWLRHRDPEVLAHLRAENDYTEAVLGRLAGLREELFTEIVGRIEETDVSTPARLGPWWYYHRTRTGSDYPVHCRCPAPPDAEPPDVTTTHADEQVILDENTLAGDGSYLAVGTLVPSPDHRWLAYGADRSGNERFGLRFRRIDERPGSGLDWEESPETVPGVSYGGGWANDNRTFLYTRVDDAMRPFEVWRHAVGTDPASDVLVLHEPDERFHLGVHRGRDGAYLVIEAESSITSETRVVPAGQPERPPRLVVPRRQGVEYRVEHHPGAGGGDGTEGVDGGGGWFVILTNDDAQDFRLVVAPADRPDRPNWRELVPHRPGVRLEGVDVLESWLVLGERLEAEPRLRVAPFPDLGEGSQDLDVLDASWLVPEPESPASTWPGSNLEFATEQFRYEQSSLVTPRTTLDVELASRRSAVRKRQPVLGDFDASRYRTFRLWARSADGTEVPMSVVHRIDLLPDPGAPPGTPPSAPAPCLLYGYGAYEHSIDPVFSSLRLSLLDRGFVFAIAHVRGGGELGRRWYEDGKVGAKAHTFDDFIACAGLLVERGFTAPRSLAGRGASAGGLLIGAVANRAPELFRALVAEVPFVDALTTILDDSLPLSVIEWEEWGNPGADPEVYAAMKAYSPYDNVRGADADGRPLRYPDILATTGLEDPRVGYWEPAKWVARLRAANPANRALLHVEMGAGHGGPSGRYDAWRDEAFVLAFVLDALGLAGSSDGAATS